jgi:hypothetical protein
VQASTDNAGILGTSIVLRRINGDSLAGSMSDASGRFRFSGLEAGNYRISARVPPGHQVESPSDTSATVELAAGEAASVLFRAAPITQLADTVQTGSTDTLTLANGVRLIVTVPAGLPSLPLTLTTAPTDQGTWNRRVIGPAVAIAFPPSASVAAARSQQLMANGPPVTIHYSLPLTGSPGALEESRARGMFVVSAPGNPFSANLNSQSTLVVNPFTGANETHLTGDLQFTEEELSSFQLAVIASTIVCADQFSLTQDNDFTGSQPLLLIHGVQLDRDACNDYAKFDPAQETFKTLIEGLKVDPTIKSTYALYTFKYPTNAGVQNASNALASRYISSLTGNGVKRVTIVAHSMGGLVARRYLKDFGSSSIEQVITLATPHLGSPLADAGGNIFGAQVQICFDQARNAPLPHPPVPSWWLLKAVHWVLFQENSQGVADLKTTSTVVDRTESAASLFSTLEGETSINGANHDESLELSGVMANAVMTAAECYLSLQANGTPNDGFVVKSSAWPIWSPRKLGPFTRDHVQMSGQDAASVNDGFLPTIINYLIYPPTNPAPVLVLVAGNNQVGSAGQPLADPITVEARTAQGAVLPHVVIQFAPDPGGGVVTPSTVSTNDGGRAVVSWTLGGAAGIQHLKATIGGYATATIAAYAVTTGGTGCPNYAPYVLGTIVSAAITTADCPVFVPPSTAIYYGKDYAAGVPQTLAIQMSMTSTAFVPWATVHVEPSGWSFGFIPPAGSQTALTNALVAQGAFAARTVGSTAGQTGPFTFSAVAISSDVTGCVPFLLTHGVVTSQQLAAGDCSVGGRTYDRYVVGIPPGWRIVVDMTSSSLDSHLELYQYDDVTLVALDNNGGGGSNARLTFTSTPNSSYYLHASSLSGTQLGSYSLAFSLLPPVSGAQASSRTGGAATPAGVIGPPQPPRD